MTDNREYAYLYSHNKKINQAEMIYYLGVIIIITKLILPYSEIITISPVFNNLLNLTFIFLMFLKVLCTFNLKIKKVHIIFALFVIMTVYTSIQIDNYIILFTALGIIALKGMNVKSIIKMSYYVKIFWLTIHFSAFTFAMFCFPNSVKYSLIDNEVRYRIFLTQPNTCAMLFLWVIFEYMYLNYEKLSFNKFLISSLFFGVIIYLTKSKTSIIVYVLLWLLIWQNKRKCIKKLVGFFSKYGYIILSAFFAFVTVNYNNLSFSRILNTFLTGRLAGAAKTYSTNGFTLFGQYLELGKKIEWDPIYRVTSIWLENAYSMMFLNFGIVYAILIAIALWYASDYLTHKDKIFVCAMLIYGISESYIVNIFLCFPLLIVASAIYNKREYLKKNYNIDEARKGECYG